MPRISVIIPSFNRKELLIKTLESIFCQTLLPHEIIVIDDSSTDGTFEFLASNYRDRLIVLKSYGKGPGAARNLGIKVSTGDFIKFFDSDDLMTSNMLEVQLNLLNSSGSGCIYSPYFHAMELPDNKWRLTDSAILQYFPVSNTHPLAYWMVRGLFITVPSFLFKKDFVKDVGLWREDIITYEDWDFLWRIAQQEPYPLHSNACAFLYRIHGVQTTGNSLNNSMRDRDKVICLLDLIRNPIVSRSFGFADTLLLRAMIAGTLRKNKMEPWVEGIGFDWDKGLYQATNTFLRIRNKVGRIATKTNWQPMHGPLVSKEKIVRYLKLIHQKFEVSG